MCASPARRSTRLWLALASAGHLSICQLHQHVGAKLRAVSLKSVGFQESSELSMALLFAFSISPTSRGSIAAKDILHSIYRRL
ncbi:hypothetical protein JG688_00005334 [Phytophthora aleatoria]|uniref:Secreted protein n=1 Tax=Phytophthora aleatoria TaxID=2496075 RepID=A0A8J5MAP6_9STRA|nr:hypothetical protein JG688_00005334 [Phytophthora aleatoria]